MCAVRARGPWGGRACGFVKGCAFVIPLRMGVGGRCGGFAIGQAGGASIQTRTIADFHQNIELYIFFAHFLL